MLYETMIDARNRSESRMAKFSPSCAIGAGAVTAMALQVTFTVLGAGLGMSAYRGGINPNSEIGAAAGWWFVTGLLSLAAGGALTGYLHSTSDGCIRAVNGFLMWCTVSLIGAIAVALGAGAALGSSMSGLTPVVVTSDLAARTAFVTNEPVVVANDHIAGMMWLTFAALLLGAAVASMVSWWVGGMFGAHRVGEPTTQIPPRGFTPASS